MIDEALVPAPSVPTRWRLAARSLNRPYRVTVPMVALVTLVPLYIVIAEVTQGRTLHAPAVFLDALVPLQPAWSLVYGALYAFLIVLPVLVVQQQEQVRRTVAAYLFIWIVAYLFFLLYPTVAPRPEEVIGNGFGAWGLRALYGADPPYNCFPSLHVAHSFVSALACYRVHRRLGMATLAAAAVVGLSTLFTKQHYVLDVVAGVLLALLAYALFLRRCPRRASPLDEAAPVVAGGLLALLALAVACSWLVYRATAS